LVYNCHNNTVQQQACGVWVTAKVRVTNFVIFSSKVKLLDFTIKIFFLMKQARRSHPEASKLMPLIFQMITSLRVTLTLFFLTSRAVNV